MMTRRRRPVRVGGSTPGSGGGGQPPPPTVNGLIKPVIYPWPPPNAIVLHAATPIQLSAAGTGLRVYFIARDGSSDVGPFFDTFSILAHTYPTDAVTLYSGRNPGTGKPVTIEYLPAEKKLRVSTFYADRPPHDFDKPYVFTVDANHTITMSSGRGRDAPGACPDEQARRNPSEWWRRTVGPAAGCERRECHRRPLPRPTSSCCDRNRPQSLPMKRAPAATGARSPSSQKP